MSEFEAQEFSGGDPVKPEREGLPPGYRMRADPHYVELLSSGARGGGDRSARGEARGDTRTGPREADITSPARVTRERRIFAHLVEEIAAIESAATMLGGDASALTRRVSLDLIKAQSARVSWLLRAQSIVAGVAPELEPRSRQVATLVAQLRDRLAAECRLAGVSLQTATESNATVTVDDGAIALGVTGAFMALLPLMAGVEGASIRIEAIVEQDGDEDDLQAIEVSQDVVPLSATARQRFFDADWHERPGGWLAATGAAVAAATAERMGGRAALNAGARRGCTIRIGFA
ncbi:MAG TPA: hypothetical protein VN700_17525 [Vicinamibacterales bacterium]|nr:hypothetical protein [Vicinamibacterales bacterium]